MAKVATTKAGATDAAIDGQDNSVSADRPVTLVPDNSRTPRLGDQIQVVAGGGRVLLNLEFGGQYSQTEASPATVTPRILRLLHDGDLLRVKPQ